MVQLSFTICTRFIKTIPFKINYRRNKRMMLLLFVVLTVPTLLDIVDITLYTGG